MTRDRYRIGMIGAGTIGQAIIRDVTESGIAAIDYIVTAPGERPEVAVGSGVAWFSDPREALSRPVDLVVEAAVPEVLSRFAPAILERSDLCGFSCTAWADRALEAAARAVAERTGHRCYLPHGAILGLDGLSDGRELLESVQVTTTKSGRSLGLDARASGVVFAGTAREACGRFPRNVNVHAAVALAGIGFERTASRIVAVPGLASMEHRIEVSGRGLAWEIRVTSRSLGGVSGAYVPASAAGSVRRIVADRGVAIA